MTLTIQDILSKYEALKSERASLDTTLDLVARFVAPLKGRFYTTNDEGAIDWRNRERYDDTAPLAAQTLASSLHGTITSPAIKWFLFRFRDDALNSNQEATAWLQQAEDQVYYALLDSNFHTETIEFFLNNVTFGTAGMLHLYAADTDKLYFDALPVNDFYFEEDVHGHPTALYLKYSYTAQQLVLQFPDTVPDHIKNDLVSTQKYDVIRAIYFEPKNAQVPTYKNIHWSKRPFQDRIILKDDGHLLASGGFYELPAYILRWGKVAGSKFGYSPAILSLGTILTLNQMIEMSLRRSEKEIDPPIITQDRNIIGNLNLRSGGLTVVRDLNNIAPWPPQNNQQTALYDRESLIRSIRQTFFVDQLELKESPAMTATEVSVRYELMQRLIGPPVTRIKSDFLDALLHRTLFMLLRQRKIPMPPESVQSTGAHYDIEYLGAWSRAQRQDEIQSIAQSIQFLAQLQAFKPDIMDIADIDKASKNAILLMGFPAEYMRSDTEVQEIREARAQQIQQQQQLQMLEQGSQAIKNLAEGGILGSQQPAGQA